MNMTEAIEKLKALEAVARAIHAARQARGFSGAAAWEYEPADIQSLYLFTAAAAIDAFLARLSELGS